MSGSALPDDGLSRSRPPTRTPGRIRAIGGSIATALLPGDSSAVGPVYVGKVSRNEHELDGDVGAGASGPRDSTVAALAQPMTALHDAIDRVRACAGEVGGARHTADRELLVMAAQDVMRALVQTRRRCRELEEEVARNAALALDVAARVLGGPLP